MSTIVETAFETVRLLGLCVLDVFNLVARPIVLWDSLLTPTEDSFKGFGFVSGFIANISVALLCAATGLGCHRLLSKQFVEQFLRMIYFPWVIDAVLQFVAMFGHSVGIPSLQFYPPSFTGFGGLLQLAVAVVVYIPYQWTRTKAWETFFVRAGFLLAAATLVYDATAVTDVWLYKALCYVLAVGYGGFGALYETPLLRQVLDGFDYIMKKIAPIVKTAMAHVRSQISCTREHAVWPSLRNPTCFFVVRRCGPLYSTVGQSCATLFVTYTIIFRGRSCTSFKDSLLPQRGEQSRLCSSLAPRRQSWLFLSSFTVGSTHRRKAYSCKLAGTCAVPPHWCLQLCF